MKGQKRRILLITFVAVFMVLYIGCTQPEDILVEVSNTNVFLSKLWNFPSSYEGMQYEVWVANQSDTVSLGKFGYNKKSKTFLDELGAVREDSNMFSLHGDLFDYNSIFISVEKNPDPISSSPSAIMLIDNATNPDDDAIKLVFPEIHDTIPLWSAIARFNMETVSDDSTYIKPGHLRIVNNTREVSTNGFGIWFANYTRKGDSIKDTLALESFNIEIDTTSFERDTVVESAMSIDNIRVDTFMKGFGLDSLQQIVVRYDTTELFKDSTPPETTYIINKSYTTNPKDGKRARLLESDNFFQGGFSFPNFSDYGWTYKGWVVSPSIDTSYGKFNPPGWELAYNDSIHNFIIFSGDNGGILTTGTFDVETSFDNDNLYTKTNRIPPVPGDEFLEMPDGKPAVNLLPNSVGNEGTVFITLEPKVLQGGTNKTNFPLFVMIRKLPSDRDSVETGLDVIQSFTMRNWTGHNTADRGFPLVQVSIERF